jgi:hypothetical protein
MYGDLRTAAYREGVHSFRDAAEANKHGGGFMFCPCVEYRNKKDHTSSRVIQSHLIRSGFMAGYNISTKHGERGVMMEDDDEEDTTRRNHICGAPFWGLVAHLACAMHIKPQVTFICGARPCAPRICIISVAHPITCDTHSICGAPHLGAPRIGCATDIQNGAPLICFPFFFQKYSRNTKYTAEIYSI